MSVSHRMKIGAGTDILPFPYRANPIDWLVLRIPCRNYGCGFMPTPESGAANTSQRALWQIRYIDVENRVTGKRIVLHATYTLPNDRHRSVEILSVTKSQRDGKLR